jgi:UrcA family protein
MVKPVQRSCRVLAAGLALAIAATAAQAQTAVKTPSGEAAKTPTGEIIVTAPSGRPNAKGLSAPVSYRDLDLTTNTGRNSLSQRVRLTARDLCRRLGQSNKGTHAAGTCEQDAVNSTRVQQRTAIAQATPKGAR